MNSTSPHALAGNSPLRVISARSSSVSTYLSADQERRLKRTILHRSLIKLSVLQISFAQVSAVWI